MLTNLSCLFTNTLFQFFRKETQTKHDDLLLLMTNLGGKTTSVPCFNKYDSANLPKIHNRDGRDDFWPALNTLELLGVIGTGEEYVFAAGIQMRFTKTSYS